MASTSPHHGGIGSTVRLDYGTAAKFWNLLSPKPKPQMVTPEMAFYCFDSLLSKLRQTVPTVAIDLPPGSYPVFVHWSVKSTEAVRGSLGTFEPLPLELALREFALASALNDARFEPIAPEEVQDLQVTVVILSDQEDLKQFLDFTIGVHGIRVMLKQRRGGGLDKQKRQEAHIFPEQLAETGLTKIETVDALMREAGFIGKITAEERHNVNITRFQTHKVTRTYEDFNQFRNWKASASSSAARHGGPLKKLVTIPSTSWSKSQPSRF